VIDRLNPRSTQKRLMWTQFKSILAVRAESMKVPNTRKIGCLPTFADSNSQ
jgi:hypothetical protein